MKIGGKHVSGSCIETLVLPREDGDIVIRAQALPDFDKFDKLCPEPKAPMVLTKRGRETNLKDISYQEMMNNHELKRIAFMVTHSLMISDIEWDTVDFDDSKTWMNYSTDLKGAGFSVIEVGRIVQTVMKANALDEHKLESARELFLQGQRELAAQSSGLLAEQLNMPSGAPAVE